MRLKARLLKAAESKLILKRRNDLEEEEAEEAEPPYPSPASVLQLAEEQAGADSPNTQRNLVGQGHVATPLQGPQRRGVGQTAPLQHLKTSRFCLTPPL